MEEKKEIQINRFLATVLYRFKPKKIPCQSVAANNNINLSGVLYTKNIYRNFFQSLKITKHMKFIQKHVGK